MPQQIKLIKIASGYLLALLLVVIAFSLRVWPLNILDTKLAWLTFYPALTLAAFYGGFWPGLFASLLSIISVYFGWPLVSDKPFVADKADHWAMLAFFINSILICLAAGSGKKYLRDKKKAIRSLQKAYDQLRSINDQLPGSIIYQSEISADGHFNVHYISKGSTEYSGGSVEEITKNPQLLISRLLEEDKPKYKAAREHANKHTETLNLDLRMNRLDGSIGWINLISTPTVQDDGNILWNGLVTDITNRKQLELKLLENEQFLNESSKLAKIGGWLLNAQTLDVVWTPEVYNMHELEVGTKVTMQSSVASYHPEDRERIGTLLQKALTTGTGFTTEGRKLTTTGRIFWVLVICKPVIVNGKITAIHGIVQDITERKELELKLDQEQINNQRLFTELVIKDYELQKNNIAYQLHEDINQLLVATKLHLENINPSQNNMQDSINKSLHQLHTAIEKINQLFTTVNIPAFKELGFIQTIEALLDNYRLNSDIHIHFTFGEREQWEKLNADTMLLLYSALSDRLHCVQQKQKAHTLDIELAITKETIKLTMQLVAKQIITIDDKIMLDMQILESRLAFYGGSLTFTNPEENHSQLVITLPIAYNTSTPTTSGK